VAEVLELPVDLAVLEQSVEVQERALVRDDLHAAGHHRVVERLRAAARLAECRLRDDPDVDAFADLADQQVAEAVADLARLEAEDEDVDVGRRRLDVGEHCREERSAIDQEVPARRDGRLEIERQAGPGRRPAEGLLDGQTSVARPDQPGRSGPPEDQPPARDHRRGSGRTQNRRRRFIRARVAAGVAGTDPDEGLAVVVALRESVP
jgi:hypothetical protein